MARSVYRADANLNPTLSAQSPLLRGGSVHGICVSHYMLGMENYAFILIWFDFGQDYIERCSFNT